MGWRRSRRFAAATALALGLGAVGSLAESGSALAAAAGSYQQARATLDADLASARAQGFAEADLQPVTEALKATPDPRAGGGVDAFLGGTAAVTELDQQLQALERVVVQSAQAQSSSLLSAAQGAFDSARQAEVPGADLTAFARRAAVAGQLQATAVTLADWRRAQAQLATLVDDLNQVTEHQRAENDAIRQAAAALLQANGNNPDPIRQGATAALAAGRNDATVAAYEALPGRFPASAAVNDLANLMEAFAGRLASGDVDEVATGAAGVERYAAEIHQRVMAGLGPKHLVVSFQDQHVWAYENGVSVMDTKVTTGIRGVTDFGTDFGPMKVLYKSHPWKFHSPWPRGSAHWYPDATVQWVTFFTDSGESFHDAYWEPDSSLGPGSQFNSWTRSHGCIHLPYGLAAWLYSWADLDTPVDVIPADGQPVSEQLSLITTDEQGNPRNPA